MKCSVRITEPLQIKFLARRLSLNSTLFPYTTLFRSLVSFIFPSEIATFYYPLRIACSICMKTLNENMFKIIFCWPHWVRVILAAFTFGETLFLIPLATAWKLEKASLTVRAGFWQTLFWQTLDFCGVDGYGRGRSRSTV